MSDVARLEEDTAFERFALGAAAPASKPQYGWIDLRNSVSPLGDVGFMAGSAISGTEALDRLQLGLRPLMLGAAWKILDLVVERAFPARTADWTIRAKVERAYRLDVPVWSPFVKSDPEWAAAMHLYANSRPLRDGIVHRRAEVIPSGELRVGGRDDTAGQTFVISAEEQLALCRASRRLIDAILAGEIAPRERDDLAFQLGQVRRYSGLPAVHGGDLRVVCEVHVNLREVQTGIVELDIPALQPAVRHQVGYRAFDVVAYLPTAPGAAPLIGKLETAPVEVVRFRLDSPPAWLSGAAERHTLPD